MVNPNDDQFYVLEKARDNYFPRHLSGESCLAGFPIIMAIAT